MKIFRENCTMFDQIEIPERVYEGQTTSKNIHRAYANHDSNVRKRNRGEAAFPDNPRSDMLKSLKQK